MRWRGGLLLLFGLVLGVLGGWFAQVYLSQTTPIHDFIEQITPEPERPLLAYTIPSLREKLVDTTSIVVTADSVASVGGHLTYRYSSNSLGKKMSGIINTPVVVTPNTPIIIMLRGWVPQEGYFSGNGTKNSSAAYAEAGFITIAPDFFGYGDSDPEPSDVWQGRFEKPLIVIQLIKTLQEHGLPLPNQLVKPSAVGLWGHSNGGQIALTTLAILQEPIPTVLWAPVSAPFPYNILYFSDEEADEGLASRKWIAQFDELYDARQFSFTNYLDGLKGPLQIHQGTNDDAVLVWWNDEFTAKLNKENTHRKELLTKQQSSTDSAFTDESAPEPITYSYFVYPGANHNLTPGWDTVVARDITFFMTHLMPAE